MVVCYLVFYSGQEGYLYTWRRWPSGCCITMSRLCSRSFSIRCRFSKGVFTTSKLVEKAIVSYHDLMELEAMLFETFTAVRSALDHVATSHLSSSKGMMMVDQYALTRLMIGMVLSRSKGSRI